MEKVLIRPINVVEGIELPEMTVDQLPSDGDPVEIAGEMYYVCELYNNYLPESQVIGVIPLVVRNPSRVKNIEDYIKCLSLAHRKIQFKNKYGSCDLKNCDEMIISE